MWAALNKNDSSKQNRESTSSITGPLERSKAASLSFTYKTKNIKNRATESHNNKTKNIEIKNFHLHQDEDHGEVFQSNLGRDQNYPVHKITNTHKESKSKQKTKHELNELEGGKLRWSPYLRPVFEGEVGGRVLKTWGSPIRREQRKEWGVWVEKAFWERMVWNWLDGNIGKKEGQNGKSEKWEVEEGEEKPLEWE